MSKYLKKEFVGMSLHDRAGSSAETSADCGNCSGARCADNEKCEKVYEFVLQDIAIQTIVNFSNFLNRSTEKWKDVEWVNNQFQHHVEECKELETACDPHLQAELLDKLIISACLVLISEATDEFANSARELQNSLAHRGVVEFETCEELFGSRFSKFISKIHL